MNWLDRNRSTPGDGSDWKALPIMLGIGIQYWDWSS